MVADARTGRPGVRSRRLTARAFGARLAVNPGGRVVVAWIEPAGARCWGPVLCPGALRVATKVPGEAFRAPATVARDAFGSPAVATNDRGDVVVAAQQLTPSGGRRGRVIAASRALGARAWRLQVVGTSGVALTSRPALALGPRGDVIVAWSRIEEFAPSYVLVAERRPGGARFGTPRVLMREGGYNLAGVLDAAGRGLVAWEADMPNRRVFSARRRAGGAWSPPTAFGRGGNLRLSADPAGAAVAWWEDHGPSGMDREATPLAARRAPGAAFSAPVQILPVQSFPVIAAGAPGRSVVAWMAPPAQAPTLWVAGMRGVARLGAGHRLAINGTNPVVAAAPSGHAAVAFSTFDAARNATVRLSTHRG